MRRGKADREIRKQQAETRAEERAKRSPQEQIELLNTRLGAGTGAARERARLATEIENSSKKSVKKKPALDDKPKTRASRRAARNKRKANQNT